MQNELTKDLKAHESGEGSNDSRLLRTCHFKKSSKKSSMIRRNQKRYKNENKYLEVLGQVNDLYQTAMDYCTHRLSYKSQVYHGQVEKMLRNGPADWKYR